MNIRTHISDAIARIHAAATAIQWGVGGEDVVRDMESIKAKADYVGSLLNNRSLLTHDDKHDLAEHIQEFGYWANELDRLGLLSEVDGDERFDFSLNDAIVFLRHAEQDALKTTVNRSIFTLAEYAASSNGSKKIADVYDEDEVMRNALHTIFHASLGEDFEYPDHSHKDLLTMFVDTYRGLKVASEIGQALLDQEIPSLILRTDKIVRVFSTIQKSEADRKMQELAVSSFAHLIPKESVMAGDEWIDAITKVYDINDPRNKAILDAIRVNMNISSEPKKNFSLKSTYFDTFAFKNNMG